MHNERMYDMEHPELEELAYIGSGFVDVIRNIHLDKLSAVPTLETLGHSDWVLIPTLDECQQYRDDKCDVWESFGPPRALQSSDLWDDIYSDIGSALTLQSTIHSDIIIDPWNQSAAIGLKPHTSLAGKLASERLTDLPELGKMDKKTDQDDISIQDHLNSLDTPEVENSILVNLSNQDPDPDCEIGICLVRNQCPAPSRWQVAVCSLSDPMETQLFKAHLDFFSRHILLDTIYSILPTQMINSVLTCLSIDRKPPVYNIMRSESRSKAVWPHSVDFISYPVIEDLDLNMYQLFEHGMHEIQDAQSQSNTTVVSETTFSEVASSSSQTKQSRRRRKDSNANKDDDENDESHDRKRDLSRKKAKTIEKEALWACPFSKMDPFNYYECQTRKLTNISYVKQHLYREHYDRHCPKCGEEFNTNKLRDDKLKAGHAVRHACEGRHLVDSGKMSTYQKNRILDDTSRKVDGSKKWFNIWEILFPSTPKPASPFALHPLAEAMESMKYFYRGPGSPFIREKFGDSGISVVDDICEHFQSMGLSAAAAAEQSAPTDKFISGKAIPGRIISDDHHEDLAQLNAYTDSLTKSEEQNEFEGLIEDSPFSPSQCFESDTVLDVWESACLSSTMPSKSVTSLDHSTEWDPYISQDIPTDMIESAGQFELYNMTDSIESGAQIRAHITTNNSETSYEYSLEEDLPRGLSEYHSAQVPLQSKVPWY